MYTGGRGSNMKKVLILGRMVPTYGDNLEKSDDTIRTAKIVEGALSRLRSESTVLDVDYQVSAPTLQGGRLFSGFMNELLGADLIIFNLTNVSANVAYEFAIVQALGKPYFHVASEGELPAYFQGEIGVRSFKDTGAFDPEEPSHVEVYSFLKSIFKGSIPPTRFSRSQITEFFDGLTLSDVSAASGLAAGYFRNSLRRFERTNGFFGRQCSGVLRPSKQDPIKFDRKIPQMYIAVEPPSRLTGSYVQDFSLVEDSLKSLNLALVDFNIDRGSDEADFRSFGGHVLARVEDETILEPLGLVILEVPTFLYALQQSALYRAFFSSDLDADEVDRRVPMEVEVLDGFIARVRRSIDYYYRNDPDVPNKSKRFKWVTIETLPSLLEEHASRYL